MSDDLMAPNERPDQIGREAVERDLRGAIAGGGFSHGWIIAGPKGAGKATLAYRIARAMLDPAALMNAHSFDMLPEARTFRLIAQRAHPDVFIAERAWNEKTSRYQSDITVETIRKLTLFLNRTAALGGYRVAIIDSADDLNRNAANALLKALEEPPADTLLLLLSAAPGRLIATIRSRCRRIDLRSLDDAEIVTLLAREELAEGEEAERIAAHAGGRPGYAMMLAAGEGASAITLADGFVTAARKGGEITRVTSALAGRAGDAKWEIFKATVLQSLSDGARAAACGATLEGPLAGAAPASLLSAHEQLTTLAERGDALNLDRGQLIAAMAYDLRAALAAS
jgi:DNA polymerase III subunit delta'